MDLAKKKYKYKSSTKANTLTITWKPNNGELLKRRLEVFRIVKTSETASAIVHRRNTKNMVSATYLNQYLTTIPISIYTRL